MAEKPDNPLMNFRIVFGARLNRSIAQVAIVYTFLIAGMFAAGSDNYYLVFAAAAFFFMAWFAQRKGEDMIKNQLGIKFLYSMLRTEYKRRGAKIPSYITNFKFPTETVEEKVVGGIRITPAEVGFETEDFLLGVGDRGMDHVFLWVEPDTVDGELLAEAIRKYFPHGSIVYHVLNDAAITCEKAREHLRDTVDSPPVSGYDADTTFSYPIEPQKGEWNASEYRLYEAMFADAMSYAHDKSRFHFLGVGGQKVRDGNDHLYHLQRLAKLAGFKTYNVEVL